ncbi:MAG: GNAT family N-acetyltransferase [Methylotenera sp.]|nr:GNAT family N-acetyltransferase [Oligoflexia bacterium]
MTPTPLQIETRSEAKDSVLFHAAFSEFGQRSRQDPYRVALASPEMILKMMHLPLGKPVEFFLAWPLNAGNAGNALQAQPLGRISANVDSTGTRGFVGFFEIDLSSTHSEEVAHALLAAAENWLKAQGVKQMIGPLDFSTWFSYRFRIEHESAEPLESTAGSSPRFAWEPVNPPEYPAFFQSFGMSEIQAYHSQSYSAPAADARLPGSENLKKAYDFAVSQGFRFRPIDLAQFQTREIPLLHELSHQCFKDAFLFEPIPLPIFGALYAQALQRFDFSPSRFVQTADGRTVGFLFAFIDRDYLVIKTIAVLEEFQNQKLSSALLHPAFDHCFQNQITRGISALVKSGAKSEHHETRSKQFAQRDWMHEYSLFGKDLP